MRSEGSRHRGRPAVVIEFVGLPGSGKSSLCRELVRSLEQSGVDAAIPERAGPERIRHRTRVGRVLGVPGRLGNAATWLLFTAGGCAHLFGVLRQRPGLVRHVVLAQVGRPLPVALRWHILRWWFAQAGRRGLLARLARPGDVLVVDDGFAHRATTLHASQRERPDAVEVVRYLDRIPPPDLTIVVRSAVATCIDRARARGPWRHRPLSDVGLAAYVSNAAQVLAVAVRRARDHGWTLIEVENERPLAVVADELQHQVLAWLVERTDPTPASTVAEDRASVVQRA